MSAFPPRLTPLLDESSPVQQLARLLTAAGHECYLVGGSVRDAFLDRAVRADEAVDIDVTTDAHPDVVEGIVRSWADAVWLQGQRFGTIGCRKDGVILEITTFRAEVYRPESRKPEVAFSDDIETDLSRRDFTVNAMALRLPDPVLVDPFGGAVDLAAARLRTPLAPEVSFLDDPLRMLRAARFIAQFELEPDPALHDGGRGAAPPARDRERRTHPRRARRSCSSPTTRAPGCGSWPRPDSPTSSFPSSTACGSSRIRSTRTRTCWPTRSPSCATRARS